MQTAHAPRHPSLVCTPAPCLTTGGAGRHQEDDVREKLLLDAELETYALVFDKDEEFTAGILAFVERHGLTGGHLTAVGAFQDVTLSFSDRQRKDYDRILIREQVEVLSLVGNIAVGPKGPQVHAHVVVGKADGTAHGGHILEAHVWPTLEVIVQEEPEVLRRHTDPETGLALLRL
jgi:uncharacterized protein